MPNKCATTNRNKSATDRNRLAKLLETHAVLGDISPVVADALGQLGEVVPAIQVQAVPPVAVAHEQSGLTESIHPERHGWPSQAAAISYLALRHANDTLLVGLVGQLQHEQFRHRRLPSFSLEDGFHMPQHATLPMLDEQTSVEQVRLFDQHQSNTSVEKNDVSVSNSSSKSPVSFIKDTSGVALERNNAAESLKQPVLRHSDLTELDRREVTMWRCYARFCEAKDNGDSAAMKHWDAEFRKRYSDYMAIRAGGAA